MSTIDADLDRIEKAQAEPEMGDLLVAYLNQLGVENEGQRSILKNLGCNSFQGYLVAKPQPAEIFEQEFLIASKTHRKKPSPVKDSQ